MGRICTKLKTTPTPNKNGSYVIKGGFVCHIFGFVCHIFCRNPLILADVYAIHTPIVWHILGAYFLQIWGVGVVRILFTNLHPLNEWGSGFTAIHVTPPITFRRFSLLVTCFGPVHRGTARGAPGDREI